MPPKPPPITESLEPHPIPHLARQQDAALEQQMLAVQGLTSSGLDDFDLPKTTVTRLAKGEAGDNVKFQQEAIQAMQKGATVFINYLADAALEISSSRSAKTIMPQDIIKAVESIDFGPADELKEILENELEAYTKVQSELRAHTLRMRNAANAASRQRQRERNKEEAERVARGGGGEGDEGGGVGEGKEGGDDDDGLDGEEGEVLSERGEVEDDEDEDESMSQNGA